MAKVHDEMRSFLNAVKAAPFEDLPRLVFADWLEDRGDARGELIRLQLERVKLPYRDSRRKKLVARENELINLHREQWTGGQIEGVEVRFKRGLLHLTTELDRLKPRTVPRSLKPLLEQGWVETVRLVRSILLPDRLEKARLLAHVTQLDASDCYFQLHAEMRQILETPHLQQLTVIDLGHADFNWGTMASAVANRPIPSLQHVARSCDVELGLIHRLYHAHPNLHFFDFGDDYARSIPFMLANVAETFDGNRPSLINFRNGSLMSDDIRALGCHPGTRNVRGLFLKAASWMTTRSKNWCGRQTFIRSRHWIWVVVNSPTVVQSSLARRAASPI